MRKATLFILMLLTFVSYGQNDNAEGIDTTRAKVKFIEMVIKDTLATQRLDTIRSYSKEPEKEIASLKKATQMDTVMAELYLEKAFAEVRTFDFQSAIVDQTKAIELNPNYKEAYFNRGLAKINTQDIEGGLADLNKAIQLDSHYADAYFGRASVRMKQGAFKEALIDFNEAIAFNPGDGKSYMLRGMCRLGLNQKDEACADLHKADELKYFQAPQMIAKYCK